MVTPTLRYALPTLVAVALLGGCAGAAPPAPATPTATPEQEALAAYERYWTTVGDAFAAPGSRDWTPQLQDVATGPALEGVLAAVRNYASFPAHTEGAVSRAPLVESAGAGSARILDCVDLGDSRLVADETGEVLDDLANRRAGAAPGVDGTIIPSTQDAAPRTSNAIDPGPPLTRSSTDATSAVVLWTTACTVSIFGPASSWRCSARRCSSRAAIPALPSAAAAERSEAAAERAALALLASEAVIARPLRRSVRTPHDD